MKRLLPIFALAAFLSAANGVRADVPELRRSGFLGVVVAPAAAPQHGLVVQGLVDGSSAKESELRPDDLIVKLDGRDVDAIAQFVQAARRLKAGEIARLEIERGDASLTIPIRVKPKPFEQAAAGSQVVYGAVEVDGHLRRTLLTAPADPGVARAPAILFATGVGCFSQEIASPRDSVAQLLHGLTAAGFVTMRVEKSSMGDSEGPACDSPEADLHAEVRGYVAGLRALKSNPRVDPAKVFIVGLSIGGVEAPLVAHEEPVKGLVVINTVSKPFLEYLLETRRRQMQLRGRSPDEIEDQIALEHTCNFQMLVEKASPRDLVAREPECAEHIQYPAPYTYMQEWAALNLAREWRSVTSPVLVIYGASDFVATGADSPRLAGIINRFHPGLATLREIEAMDHGMTKADSMAASFAKTEPGDFQPKVLEVMTQWLRGQGA